MTNEEKAATIGVFVRDTCITYGVSRDNAEIASTLCQQSAMQMAVWKDEQELKFLQELCVHSNLGIVFEKMQNRIKELKLWK